LSREKLQNYDKTEKIWKSFATESHGNFSKTAEKAALSPLFSEQ
jgi:hypothetical protein